MAVSQPLNLADSLREALRDAQKVLDQYNLTGKINLVPEVAHGGAGGGLAGVESSMDRTAKAAKDAVDKSIVGSDSGGPLGGSDKLVEVMQRLIKVFEGAVDGGLGSGKPRRNRAGGSPLDHAAGADEPGYVNPYILQGLIQNPLGTTQNALLGMLMGGAGMGIKAPTGIMSALAGSSGFFRPGVALGSNTGLLGAGEAGASAAPWLVGAAKIAVPLAAMAGTLQLERSLSKKPLQDATDYMTDRAFGQNTGMNWRGGAWTDEFQSRMDIRQQDIKEIISSSGLGMQGLVRHQGNWGTVDAIKGASESALSMGITPGQMGGILGAGVRSGTFSMQGKDGTEQLASYLARIEGWTAKTAQFGFSSNESLQKLAELSQKGMQGTNVLTKDAQASLMSMDALARQRLPPELQRKGADSALGALGAEPTSDTQRVLMMNRMMDHGQLSPEGEGIALRALGAHDLQKMKDYWGAFAPSMIAQAAVDTDLGRKLTRGGAMRDMVRGGKSPALAMLSMGTGHPLQDMGALDLAMDPAFGHTDATIARGGKATNLHAGGIDEGQQGLAVYAQSLTRLSGLTNATAESFAKLDKQMERLTRRISNALSTSPGGVTEWDPISMAFRLGGATGLGR